MASRYLFKVEYGENRFCSFFVNLMNINDYSFIKLTNDIKQHVRALQVTTPNTIRIRFRDEDGDYVNLPYGDNEMFIEMFQSGKLVNDRDYTKIHLKVSELDSPMSLQVVKKEHLQDIAPETKPQTQTKFEPVMIDDDPRETASKRNGYAAKKLTRTNKTSRSLDSIFCSAASDMISSENTTTSNASPLQRYVDKLEDNVNRQERKVFLLRDNLHAHDEKLAQAKSMISEAGQFCSNCHLKLGHSARNCSLDRCTDVFSCGVEKYHPRQVNRSKLIQELKKEENTLQKMKTELNNRRSAIKSLEKAPAHQIEQRLMSENGHNYVVGGLKDWSLLRRHVHLIESYCKRHFHGKIPPKESLTDILQLAEHEDEFDDEETTLLHSKRRRTHENPSKSVLERFGVNFPHTGCVSYSPSSRSSCTSTSCESKYEVRRFEPTTLEEEEAQLELALQASSVHMKSSTDQPSKRVEEEQPTEQSEPVSNETDAANVLMSLFKANTR